MLVFTDVSVRPIGPIFKGPIGCPETSVTNYHPALRQIPEEHRSHLHRGGNLKTHMGRLKYLGDSN